MMKISKLIDRRQIIKAAGLAFCLNLQPAKAKGSEISCDDSTSRDEWLKAKEIRAKIIAPMFPYREFVITDHGAVGDGSTINTSAINETITLCHKLGGGRVVIPDGVFLTGAIVLLSNVELHVSEHAELKFSQDTKDYLPLVQTWFEGVELMNYRPFIHAFNAENVAITGNGLLNGGGSFDGWWSWRGPRSWKGAKSGTTTGWQPGMPYQKSSRDKLMQMAADNVTVSDRQFGEGHYLRTSMIEFNRCNNVLIEGVTVKNAPFWSIHPVLSTNVTARNVKIDNPVGANADGIDPESCNYVLIDGCRFDNGDDCVSLKSGRNHDGRRINTPCRNVVISNCHFSSERSAISCGSEATGGVNNIFVENVDASHVFRLFRIKTNTQRGGVIKDIYIKNVKVDVALENLIEIQANFSEPLKDDPLERNNENLHVPSIGNINVENLYCRKAYRALNLLGTKLTPINGLNLTCVTVEHSDNSNVIKHLASGAIQQSRINGKTLEFTYEKSVNNI